MSRGCMKPPWGHRGPGVNTMGLGIVILGILLVAAVVTVAVLATRLQRVVLELAAVRQAHDALQQRFRGVLDADAEQQRVLGGIEGERARVQGEFDHARAGWEHALRGLQDQHARGQAELGPLLASVERARADLNALDEEANLRSFGFYKPHYDFASSDRFQAKLDEIRDRQKAMIKSKTAAIGHIEWTVNGSKTEGRKQINQTLKLMLRAFNGECDAAIAKVKYNNIHVMEERIRKSNEAIDALVVVQQCTIARQYVELKIEELRLAHEYQEKLQQEKEEQRRIREQMRDEELALREMEKARKEAEQEEQRYAAALAKARTEAEAAVGAKQEKLLAQVAQLEQRLAEAQQNARAIAQAQLTRTGHVYVISNVGSFGEHVYKIGMTRRLNPIERVDELGAASVPFDFDVHAMIHAKDAPALETALHHVFHERRVNRVNVRKEFFRATIDEIVAEVAKLHGEVEVTKIAEAEEFRKTQAMIKARQSPVPELVPVESSVPATVNA